MAGPRITEVSLSPDGFSRYAGAAHISVLIVLLTKQTDSRSPDRDCRVESYAIVKVLWHGDHDKRMNVFHNQTHTIDKVLESVRLCV